MPHSVPVALPRHAFNVRHTARAGEVWRLLQDVAVEGSRRAGWPPERYREEDIAFVVRSETVVHHREIAYGRPITAITWVSSFRREIVTEREIRLEDGDGTAVAATQEWVHVQAGRPARASQELVSSFPIENGGGNALLPEWEPVTGPSFRFELQVWHVTMDPLGHANHPAYVDWCDEALARWIHGLGGDPVDVIPVAETVSYRGGVLAPEVVTVDGAIVGRAPEGHALDFTLSVGERVAAKATLVRILPDYLGLPGA